MAGLGEDAEPEAVYAALGRASGGLEHAFLGRRTAASKLLTFRAQGLDHRASVPVARVAISSMSSADTRILADHLLGQLQAALGKGCQVAVRAYDGESTAMRHWDCSPAGGLLTRGGLPLAGPEGGLGAGRGSPAGRGGAAGPRVVARQPAAGSGTAGSGGCGPQQGHGL